MPLCTMPNVQCRYLKVQIEQHGQELWFRAIRRQNSSTSTALGYNPPMSMYSGVRRGCPYTHIRTADLLRRRLCDKINLETSQSPQM